MCLHSIREMQVAKLRPSKRNARTHSKKQVGQIATSIRTFGWTYPILVDEKGNILCGVGRWLAAQQLGLKTVPVIELSHLNEIEKRALMLADNKIAANAGWARDVLAVEIPDLAHLLPEIDLSFDKIGFETAEIDSLLGDMVDAEADPADTILKPATIAVSKVGHIWRLGVHRLFNGDSLMETSFKALMGPDKARMVIADGPYNVAIATVVGRGKTKHREFEFASGEMSSTQFITFNRDWMTHAARYSIDGSIHFVFMSWPHMAEILAAGSDVYSELKNLVVWAKTNAGQGSFYRSQHELIFVFKNGDHPHQNNIQLGRHGRNRSNVWSYAGVNTFRSGRMAELSLHPTVKPIALVADSMRDCSKRGDIVLDPFMGSGTTILAAEKVGRRAFGIELDPLYVDVAIRRWQQFTGRDAVLDSTGQTFDEVAESRARPRQRVRL